MRALIDGDMPANELGHMEEEYLDGEEKKRRPMAWDLVKGLATGRFISIVTNAEAGGHTCYLSHGKTFRHELATIRPYKGTRKPKPELVDRIKDLYEHSFGAQWCDGYEADDAMAMDQWSEYRQLYQLTNGDEEHIKSYSNTVICSRDKDLDTVPGWHFKWTLKKDKEKRILMGEVHPERPPYYVTLIEATRNFYKQMLMGDAVDNIAGLYNVGKKSVWLKQLDEMDNEAEMYNHVKDKYVKYFSDKWKEFLDETGKLLWLWRKPNDIWKSPAERDNSWYE
jgi:hypothetical protein